MPTEPDQPATDLLRAAQAGDAGAAEQLLAVVYEQLHQLARARMAHLPRGQTLQPTALVHEAYLRLTDKSDVAWESRKHFFFAAVLAMRDILVEQARRKTGPGRRAATPGAG
jgi:RNA polymerase sigma factor (TIGR02999 family)